MKGYYLVQYDPEKKALRNVSAGALGGLFTMEEFWTKQRVDAMVAWLTPVYGSWVGACGRRFVRERFVYERRCWLHRKGAHCCRGARMGNLEGHS